jgi:hypothetical protein
MFTETEEKIYAEPWKEVGLASFLPSIRPSKKVRLRPCNESGI